MWLSKQNKNPQVKHVELVFWQMNKIGNIVTRMFSTNNQNSYTQKQYQLKRTTSPHKK